MRLRLFLVFLLFWTVPGLGTAFAGTRSNLDEARTAFQHGKANAALWALDAAIHQNSNDAAAWNLQCRVYLAQGRSDDAVASCQRAVQLAPSSMNHLWLARALGEKASQASLMSAYKTAKLAHAEFESAVALDGSNREALSDLGQYYVEAPRILGGGSDKAEAIANRLSAIDPARADELRARIAESKKDYASAEQALRAKIAASHASPEAASQAWMDLGSFYQRRGRWNDMLAALKKGASANIAHGPALVDGASTLIVAKRETALAAQWLREYLNGHALSETAPAFAVHAELGDLLKKQGDKSGADREFAAARALSETYVETATVNTGD